MSSYCINPLARHTSKVTTLQVERKTGTWFREAEGVPGVEKRGCVLRDQTTDLEQLDLGFDGDY